MMNAKSSIQFFTGVLIVTGILLVIIGVNDYHAKKAVDFLKERYAKIDQLRTQIVYFDDILTMSARMAAATGDIKWELRYHAFEPKLTAAIRQAMAVSPEVYRKETDRNSFGKVKLLEMEHKAFVLIGEGKGKEAMNILFGNLYEHQRNNYSKAVENLSILLKKQMDAALEVENSKEHLSQIAFISVFILLLLSWLTILRITRSSQEALIQTNRRLDELNKTLDQKVQERTEHLQKVQGQLLQSEKFSAIGQLAAGVAHEINNPIGYINSNLQTLEKYVPYYTPLLGLLHQLEKAVKDKDEERAFKVIFCWEKLRKETNFDFIEGDIVNLLQESREGTESMRKIVADLCSFASPDKGIEDYVDLEALMERMLNIVYNEIKYKAELKKEYGKVPPVVCNPQKIGQVFVNLLTNAAHAIEAKGTITIKTYPKDEYVCVDISDTGCGIPSENFSKIFDPFYTTRPVGQGVGLGLSISYDIIRRHGGDITFISEVGKGTTFTVMLPIEYANDEKPLQGGSL